MIGASPKTSVTSLKKRVLVVDDKSEIRLLYTIMLKCDFEVDEASNASAAIEMIRRNKPSAIILDICMPGTMNGLDLCWHIKQSAELKNTKIIVVTGEISSFYPEKAEELGADHFFVKPLSPYALLARLNMLLASKNTGDCSPCVSDYLGTP